MADPAVYCLAYPDLDPSDIERIERFRAIHDTAKADMVRAHVTLMFAMDPMRVSAHFDHFEQVASTVAPIRFHCRYAMLGRDHSAPVFHVFLVPDDGFAAISRLHDQLYTGPFADLLRLDIPYVPHITLGSTTLAAEAKSLCDGLNSEGLSIAGSLSTLTLATLGNGQLSNDTTFTLRGHA